MRVCLINPPSSFLLDDLVFPPLGILRIAACLEGAGHEVEVINLAGRDPILPLGIKADSYGITATSPQMPAVMRILPQIQGHTILGGAHPTMVAAAAKRGSVRGGYLLSHLLSKFSCVVAGDGELAILPALHAYSLLDADDPKSPYYVKDQDSLPLPSRHLLNLSSYNYRIDGKRATSIVTQLGCPFGCGFCGGRYSPFYRRVRLRTVPTIMEEIRLLHQEHGFEGFMFLDDELNVAPQMVSLMHSLSDYQKDQGIRFSLRGFIKASLFTESQADSLRDAGFSEVLFGFESGSNRILKNIQKGSVEDNTRAVGVARRAGLRVKALMSVGHPGESEDSVRDTREWLLDSDSSPDEFDITVITTYPGTPYWDDAIQDKGSRFYTYTAKSGDRLHMEDTDYTTDSSYYKGAPGQYRSHVWTDFLSQSKMESCRDSLEKDVRDRLNIPWPAESNSTHEHSMGQNL